MTERQVMVDNESNLKGHLPLSTADIMIENCIGTLSLPLGISPNFIIDQKHFIVPYCVEEPSVIAAASSTSKLIAKNGGFITEHSARNVMIGQVQITQIPVHSIEKAVDILSQNESRYIQNGNDHFCASMVKRGGGIIKIEPRVITPRIYKHNKSQRNKYIVVHIHVDVCDAMGANKVNTVCEGLSILFISDLKSRLKSRLKCPAKSPLKSKGISTAEMKVDIDSGMEPQIGLRILSNLCTERMTTSSFCIPIGQLSWKGVDGMKVATQIVSAYEFAMDDIYRATTNNKGIMNGMDAVAIALGQDWRAIEAAAHCFASISNEGQYGPLAHYHIEYREERQCHCLCGYMTIPIAVGTKGGSIGTHPGYQYTVNRLLSIAMEDGASSLNAKDIAGIIVSAGLASNFAAIRALAIEGIQKGHMALHSKNIAHSVLKESQIGLVEEVSQFMNHKKDITTKMASRYMKARNIEFGHRYLQCLLEADSVEADQGMNGVEPTKSEISECFPSSLIVQIPSSNGVVEVDVVIECVSGINMEAVHLEMKLDENAHIVLSVGNEEKMDKAQIESIVKSVTSTSTKLKEGDERRQFQEETLWKLFGSNAQEICKDYHGMSHWKDYRVDGDDEQIMTQKVVNEAILISLLIARAVGQYQRIWNGLRRGSKEEVSFMVLICEAMRRYIIKTYHDGDESEFEKRKKLVSKNMAKYEDGTNLEKVVRNGGDLMQFRECLIRSLLRALLYRVNLIEAKNSGEIGYRVLLRQLLSMNGLRTDSTGIGIEVEQVSKM